MNPTHIKMDVLGGLAIDDARIMARVACEEAAKAAPKLSGKSASRFYPMYSAGWFGVGWEEPYIWYQETGIRPFTMRSLAGKTIPMWIDDPDGEVERENPGAKTRTMAEGRRQTLIFRKAAPIGSRKVVERKGVMVEVPRSYPGAPGRIKNREPAAPYTPEGRIGGAIARGNVGVRWRHPGLDRKGFIRGAIDEVAAYYGFSGYIRDSFGRFA